jgi:DNA-binding transcriptional ArsR family regulator
MSYRFELVQAGERVREMEEAGEEHKRGEQRRKKTGPGEKARRARAARRRGKPNGRRRRVNLIVAIAHPLRRRILQALHNRSEPRSPAQIARAFDLPVGMVAYHANVLSRLGAVEPAGEQQVRGAVEPFYDSTIEDDPPIETLLDETREVDDEDK